jgi:hypothetical protein
MTDNLELWHSVERTDPKHVKPITGKSYSGDSPKPHYLILKATEAFGPCGIGWGFEVMNERIETSSNGDKTSFARVRVWYHWKDKKGVVEHVGGTAYSYVSSKGKPVTDEDAPKKSVTDALTKALSLIGFAGDIFLGQWNDSKYQAELREEYAPPAERAPAEEFKPATEPQIKILEAEMKRAVVGWKRLLAHYKLESKDQISISTAEAMIADIKALPTPEAKTQQPAEPVA